MMQLLDTNNVLKELEYLRNLYVISTERSQHFIGYERDNDFFKSANDRIDFERKQVKLF